MKNELHDYAASAYREEFSRETEPEYYVLTNEDGTVGYGGVYVLRTSGKQIHYYYRRDFYDESLDLPSFFTEEDISFSCGGKEYELKDRTHFTADIDFTKNEQILMIEDEPCYFK